MVNRFDLWDKKTTVSSYYGVMFALRSEKDARKLVKILKKGKLHGTIVRVEGNVIIEEIE
jgi:hypothetical protein